MNVCRRTVNLRRPERAQNEGSTGPRTVLTSPGLGRVWEGFGKGLGRVWEVVLPWLVVPPQTLYAGDTPVFRRLIPRFAAPCGAASLPNLLLVSGIPRILTPTPRQLPGAASSLQPAPVRRRETGAGSGAVRNQPGAGAPSTVGPRKRRARRYPRFFIYREDLVAPVSHLHLKDCTAGSSGSFTALRKDAGLCLQSVLTARLKSAFKFWSVT